MLDVTTKVQEEAKCPAAFAHRIYEILMFASPNRILSKAASELNFKMFPNCIRARKIVKQQTLQFQSFFVVIPGLRSQETVEIPPPLPIVLLKNLEQL